MYSWVWDFLPFTGVESSTCLVHPSRVEFFPSASILMSPSCLLTQHVTMGAASVAGCMCVCMQVRVPGWCLVLWESWACGVLCGQGPAERIVNPSGHWFRLRIDVVRFSRPPPAHVGNTARPLSCCSAHAAPVQYSARAGLQVTRICPQMPAAGVLKAHCQRGLLALPPPSAGCFVPATYGENVVLLGRFIIVINAIESCFGILHVSPCGHFVSIRLV